MTPETVHRRPPICFAALGPMACEREAVYRIETARGDALDVCERHRRLLEVKCDREGLEPRVFEIVPEAPELLLAAGAGG